MEIKRITPEEAKELLDSNSGYVYLDVRTVQEFDAGHVPSAKNIPVVEPDASGRMQLNPRFVEIVEKNSGKEPKYITGFPGLACLATAARCSFPGLLFTV